MQVASGEGSSDLDGFVLLGFGRRDSDVFLDEHGPERVGEVPQKNLFQFVALLHKGVVVLLELLQIAEHVVVERLFFLVEVRKVASVFEGHLEAHLHQILEGCAVVAGLHLFFYPHRFGSCRFFWG